MADITQENGSIPRHYAAASLKRAAASRAQAALRQYSAALRRGLIEAGDITLLGNKDLVYSAALRRGLIEANNPRSVRSAAY